MSYVLRRVIMPDDKTLATILAICDLIKHNGSGVGTVVEAYERAMKEVIEYRRSKGLTEVGGLPGRVPS
jgi:predicted HTH transcriptional regulator